MPERLVRGSGQRWLLHAGLWERAKWLRQAHRLNTRSGATLDGHSPKGGGLQLSPARARIQRDDFSRCSSSASRASAARRMRASSSTRVSTRFTRTSACSAPSSA